MGSEIYHRHTCVEWCSLSQLRYNMTNSQYLNRMLNVRRCTCCADIGTSFDLGRSFTQNLSHLQPECRMELPDKNPRQTQPLLNISPHRSSPTPHNVQRPHHNRLHYGLLPSAPGTLRPWKSWHIPLSHGWALASRSRV